MEPANRSTRKEEIAGYPPGSSFGYAPGLARKLNRFRLKDRHARLQSAIARARSRRPVGLRLGFSRAGNARRVRPGLHRTAARRADSSGRSSDDGDGSGRSPAGLHSLPIEEITAFRAPRHASNRAGVYGIRQISLNVKSPLRLATQRAFETNRPIPRVGKTLGSGLQINLRRRGGGQGVCASRFERNSVHFAYAVTRAEMQEGVLWGRYK